MMEQQTLETLNGMYNPSVIKMVGGLDVIGEIVNVTDETFTVSYPMVASRDQYGNIQLSLWSPLSAEQYHPISHQHVLSVTQTRTDVGGFYGMAVLKHKGVEQMNAEETSLLNTCANEPTDTPTGFPVEGNDTIH